MKTISSIFLFLYISVVCFSQQTSSLLIAEYDENGAENKIQHLVKYSFKNGELIERVPIVSVKIIDEKTQKNYVRFDVGTNHIYRNRYIITGIGNIIDIKNKKILHDLQEPFVACMGDSVLFYTNDIFKGKYYSIYNLKTEKYFKVENPNFKPFGNSEVEFDVFTQPFTISKYDISGRKTVLVSDAGYGEANLKDPTKAKQIPPIYWLDKNKTAFVYANYSKTHKSATLYKVGLDGKPEKIGVIDSIPMVAANSFFKAGVDGNIIYSCGKGRYLVDVQNKKLEKITFENAGYGFTIESKENQEYGRIIKYNNTEIVKKWCRFDNAQTTTDYIAIENEMHVNGERFPQGVAVWYNPTAKWKKLKLFELASIVGWITE
jgi:hypothetical protein